MAEHTDLRHIMGVGIAITRGSAASLSFCYCLLLLTMSRNLLTKLKEFSVQQYIPLDSHIQVPLKHEYNCTELHDEVDMKGVLTVLTTHHHHPHHHHHKNLTNLHFLLYVE
jgi:hypothetical protein